MAAIRAAAVVIGTISSTIALPVRSVLAAPTPPPPADYEIVYCLSTPHRAELVDAAVALGLAQPSKRAGELTVRVGGAARDLTPQGWHDLRPAEFNQACRTLIRSAAVAIPPPAPEQHDSVWSGVLAGLTQVVAGAVIGGGASYVAGWRRDLATNRRTLATDLATSIRGLRAALTRFLGASGTGSTAREEVRLARSDTLAAIRRITAAFPKQQPPADLELLLTRGEFGAGLLDFWVEDTEDRAESAGRIWAQFERAEDAAGRIAFALQRRTWPWVAETGRAASQPSEQTGGTSA